MTHEEKARAMIAKRPLSELVRDFEVTNEANNTPELFTVRGWLMDELQKRNSVAFEAWVDSNDESPRKYFLKGARS